MIKWLRFKIKHVRWWFSMPCIHCLRRIDPVNRWSNYRILTKRWEEREPKPEDGEMIYEGYFHLETGRKCPKCGIIVRTPNVECPMCDIPFEECMKLEMPKEEI